MKPYDTEGLRARVDALAKQRDASCVVGVYKNGEALFRAAYGYKDREKGTPMGLDARFAFDLRARYLLALCALTLADEKKLGLNDTLDRFLPEYKHAKSITVRQLFQGSSGVPDYLARKWFKRLDADEAHRALSAEARFARERLLSSERVGFARLLTEIGGEELAFKPGTDMGMNPSEQVLLWELIERASQMRLFDCLKARVLDPLGMRETVEGRAGDAAYYGRISGKTLVRMPEDAPLPAFTTTLGDMEKLLAAFMSGALLSKATWKNALKMSAEGIGIGFSDADGTYVADADAGFAAGAPFLYFSQESASGHIVLFNEEQSGEYVGGSYEAFCPKLRREVEAASTFPRAPRVVSCGKRYGYGAMRLEIEPEQMEFVPDAKSCVAICYVERPYLKPFVLVEGNRPIGLIALRANGKKEEYRIDFLLVDRRFQGRGYGKILLRFGIGYLKKRGAKELTIGVNRRNHAARRLYESLGFAAAEVYEEGVLLKMRLGES
ncbi:MAG: GNAT family N-acetyltransferase [Clostridiaceae bacterium]